MGYPLVYVDRTGVFTGTAGVAWHCGGTPWPQPNSLQVAGASMTPHMTIATAGSHRVPVQRPVCKTGTRVPVFV